MQCLYRLTSILIFDHHLAVIPTIVHITKLPDKLCMHVKVLHQSAFVESVAGTFGFVCLFFDAKR